MRHPDRLLRPLHPALGPLRRDLDLGQIGRREFLTRASALGLAVALPRQARSQTAEPPGLRIQMRVLPQSDPRLYDFTEKYNAVSGLLDTLVRVERDGRLAGVLVDRWETSDDGRDIRLHLREGVTWSNGDRFTAGDVLANLDAWCDSTVAGNSMAARLGALIDPGTGRLRTGAALALDPLTVALHLEAPDITLLPGLTDYPAAVMHPSRIGASPLDQPIGTGAYRIADYQPGSHAVLERDPARTPWRAGHLDRIEFVDLGPDPLAYIAAARAHQIDVIYDSIGETVAAMDSLGWQRSEIDTSSTIVLRANQRFAPGTGDSPYADPRVRRALSLAVDNAVMLELGYAGRGLVAENHHVAPMHPAYARIDTPRPDPRAARMLMHEAGMMDYEHDLVSIDDDWRRFTADVMAAQLRDAGFKVNRRILPAAEYHAGWKDFGFSATNWNGRELAVQVLDLAYRSGATWNETGFANADFDRLLDRAKGLSDVEERRAVMAELERILIANAVIVQPYWRRLIRHARPGVLGARRHQKDIIDGHDLALAGWGTAGPLSSGRIAHRWARRPRR